MLGSEAVCARATCKNMSSNSLTIIRILFLFLFSLTDPPGPPYIEGYSPGDTLRRGQSVELICRSRGGNPPAQLIWYKNGSQIRMAYRYVDVSPFALQLVYIFSFSFFFIGRTSGRLSENIYSFTAEAGDNKARFRCEASNVMSQTPLKAEVDLAVLCKCNTHETHSIHIHKHSTDCCSCIKVWQLPNAAT